jgi:hypothetical protein
MSNDNRDRKLKHHEKPIWRKAFEASMQHTSIEGATRNAWKAVDAWNQANAFNEPSQSEDRTINCTDAFHWLTEWLSGVDVESGLNKQEMFKLWETVSAFENGESNLNQFKNSLHSIFPFE